MNLNTAGWASATQRLIARLRSDGLNSTTPVTEINGGNISATNADVALVAKGTGATLAQVPDGTRVGGDKRGAGATDWQKERLNNGQVASGVNSVISGGRYNLASGLEACVGGGFNNRAQGQQSVVAGGNANDAQTTYATIAGGASNQVYSSYGFIGSGSSNGCSQFAFVGNGAGNSASASYSSVVNGVNHTAGSNYSFIAGGAYGTTRSIVGYHIFPACFRPIATTIGCTQSGLLLLGNVTSSTTPTVLRSDNLTVSSTNQLTLGNNTAYSFSGEVIAYVTAAGDTARWTINGAIKRGATAATTALVGTPTVTMTHNDAGAAAWTVTVTADTTLGCLKVQVVASNSATIRWVCKLTTTEVGF